MEILSAAVLLFLVMDPLGNIPLFLSTLSTVEEKRRVKIIARELLIALLALVLFLLGGDALMGFLGLRQESLSIAGGIIIFLISLKMIFPNARGGAPEDELSGEPFIVPLAIPLVAGPSAFATLLLLSSRPDTSFGSLGIALLVAWGISAVILMASTLLQKVLGIRGLIAVERLMGMLLVALAVQMFLDGVKSYLAT